MAGMMANIITLAFLRSDDFEIKAPYLFPNQAWCPFLEFLAPSGTR